MLPTSTFQKKWQKWDMRRDMKKEEAEEVIKILLKAEGGCEYCVESLLKLFCQKFPEFNELAEKAFKEAFNRNLFE